MTVETARSALIAETDRWKRDIIMASSPKTTGNAEDLPLHLVVLAMLGAWPKALPALDSGGARVTRDGLLLAPICFESGKDWPITVLGKEEHTRDALRRLADRCKLNDVERVLMFDRFKTWIKHDARADDPHKERLR